MRPTASYFLKRLSTECTDPPRAEKMMKSMTKQLLRRNRSILQRNFLEKLSRRELGTNKAERAARGLSKDCCNKEKGERFRKKILQNIMKAKAKDAKEVAETEDSKYHQEKKKLSKMIPNNHIQTEFRQFCHIEANHEWKKQKEKFEKKVKHLEEKYKAKKKVKDTIRDVKVSDEALGPIEPLSEPSFFNIDSDNISTNVKEVLKLHPKLALHKPISLVDVKTEIQKGFYKQRLNMKSEEEREEMEETEEEAEERERKSHALVDRETNTINFNNLRPTDLPTNRQIGVPPLATNKVEIQMAAIEAELVGATNEYIEKECDKKGVPKVSNITKGLEDGIKEVAEMVKEGVKVVTETDKSSKFLLTDLESYKAMAEPHINQDKVVTKDEVSGIERLLNGHNYQFCRIFGVGTGWDDGKRVKGAVTNKNLPPPCLKLCPKDHKIHQPGQPMACRPICGASISHNGQLSHLLSLILNEVARLADRGTECKSTEDMIAEMEEKVNKRNDITQLFVGSSDVKALYPSLLCKATTEIIQGVFIDSDINFDGINWAEAGKYIAINLTPQEINELEIQELVSTRRKSGGRFPGNTTAEVMGTLYREDGAEVQSLFLPPKRLPNQQEKKILLSQVLKISIQAVLSNHTYQFGGQIKIQTDGSPIGLELAGALARVVMIWWDQEFLRLAAENDINLYFYKRFVDDANMAGKPLPPGTRWEVGPWAGGMGGRMVVKEERVMSDLEEQEDVRTMRELCKMGNTVSAMIQLEGDTPCENSDKKLPILDVKVWVKMVEEGETCKAKLFYQYYRKPMSNWLLMPEMSAMPKSVKRTALTQYGLRILRNTKLEVDWQDKAEMLTTFMKRLRDSGYKQIFRQEILESILAGWEKMVEEHEAGRRPINRATSWKEKERQEAKWRKKTTWFKQGGYSTVIFCPYTPESKLANRWREIEARGADSRGWRFKVVELGGRQVKSIICKNPWAGPCDDPRCFVDTTGGRGSCSRPGCNYQIQCIACRDHGPDSVPEEEEEEGERRPGQGQVGVPCLALYHGQSGYSGFTRGLEHQSGKEKHDKKNALWRHCQLYHQSREVEFSMSVNSTPSEPLTRLCREGVKIISGDQDILLNSKQEFLQGAVPSTRVQRGFGR